MDESSTNQTPGIGEMPGVSNAANIFSAIDRHGPDVLKSQRITVILEIDRAVFRAFCNRSRSCSLGQFHLFVNRDTVVLNRRPGIFGLLSRVIKFRGVILDVVRLPAQRRETHVDIRLADFVDAAAFVVLTGEPERVQHLDFVAALQVTAAVAAGLTTCVGHEARHKLDVQLEAAELLFAGHTLHQQFVITDPATFKVICSGSVEQNNGTLRRFASDRGRHTWVLREFSDTSVIETVDCHTSVLRFAAPGFAFQNSRLALHFAHATERCLAVPAVAWLSAGVSNPGKFAATFSDHLQTEFEFSVAGLDAA